MSFWPLGECAYVGCIYSDDLWQPDAMSFSTDFSHVKMRAVNY